MRKYRISGSACLSLTGLLFYGMASGAVSAGQSCPVFFDTNRNTVSSNIVQPNGTLARGQVDITPEPQQPNAFSEAVLQACGEFGSAVNPESVRALTEKFSPDLMKELARELPKLTDAQLRSGMWQAWTSANAFEHVFCGQPKSDKLGGLHFAGRYQQLQQKGQLCRLENNLENEEILSPSVYTIGISTSNGVIDRKKGFSVRQSAEDILFEATRTYVRNCMAHSNERVVCVSRFYKDQSFGSLFVCAPQKGIITFYPLAVTPKDTPYCK